MNQQKGQAGQAPSRAGLQPLPFGNEFQPEPGAANKAIGTYVFIYQAVKEGQAELNMDYIAPGGPGVTERRRSVRIAQFKVTIDVAAVKAKAPVKGNEEKSEQKPAQAQKDPPKYFTNSVGMKFVWIPAGSFMMGSPRDELERMDNEAQHKVTLTQGFYMGVHRDAGRVAGGNGHQSQRFQGRKKPPRRTG